MSGLLYFFLAGLTGLFLVLYHRTTKEEPPSFQPYERTLSFKFNPRLQNGERVYVGVAIHVSVIKLVFPKAIEEALFPFAQEQAYLWALGLKAPPETFHSVQYSVLREMMRTISFPFLKVEKVAVIIGPLRKKEVPQSSIESKFELAQKIALLRDTTNLPELRETMTTLSEEIRMTLLTHDEEESELV